MLTNHRRTIAGRRIENGKGASPKSVPCPRPACEARPNESCVQKRGIGGGGYDVPLKNVHEERKVAARAVATGGAA